MSEITEIKRQQEVVSTIGDFANSLQQIAAMRMSQLRVKVLSSRRFVEEATVILRELYLEQQKRLETELEKVVVKKDDLLSLKPIHKAIIVITSNQGLCGSYNTEVTSELKKIMPLHQEADYYIIGRKGQSFMGISAEKYNVTYYNFSTPEIADIEDLKPLIDMFYYYQEIYLLYSKYINTTTREVVFVELSIPNVTEIETEKEIKEGKYVFEPDVDKLIESVSSKLRYALFRQQLLDSKLALFSSQMIAMKAASDNAKELKKDLKQQFNKARRKIVDKKIQEVQAGRVLWESAEDTISLV